METSGVTRGLSQGRKTLLKGAHWSPFGYEIISSQKLTYVACMRVLSSLVRATYVDVSLRAHPVRGASYIQRQANREVAAKVLELHKHDYL